MKLYVYIPIIFNSSIINGSCNLTDNPYRKFINFFLTPLVYTIGPLTIIILFTRGTIRNLRAKTLVNQRDHLTKQIRRMLIPQLIILGISSTPFGLQNIYTDLTSQVQKDALRKAIELLVLQFVRLYKKYILTLRCFHMFNHNTQILNYVLYFIASPSYSLLFVMLINYHLIVETFYMNKLYLEKLVI